jgi:hypothetical protein
MLQKKDIYGNVTTTKRYTTTQIISFFTAIGCLFLLHNGFSDNFAGYVISFLGIFIGLFTAINISIYERKDNMLANYQQKDQVDKARFKKIKNFLLQFSGLISYSILIGLAVVVLLLLVLLFDHSKDDIQKLTFIRSITQLNIKSALLFIKGACILAHRFFVIFFLCLFFFNTLYAISIYFSFLQSEYKNIRLKDERVAEKES